VSTERSSLFFVVGSRKTVHNKAIQKISELAESVLADTGFFLIDVEIKGGNQPVIWVYVDAENRGINMDECADFSKELSFLMDAHEVFGGSYRLNVSSPGVGRSLSDKRQYPKNKGRKTRIKFKDNENYLKVEGILKEVSDSEIMVEKEDGSLQAVTFDQLVEARVIPTI